MGIKEIKNHPQISPNFRVDVFLFRKIFKGISFVKLKVSSILGENGEKSNSREFPLKGALYPGASLARAALERDFLYNHGGRRY